MLRIILSSRFKRSYKKFKRSFPYLQENIDNTIKDLSENPFSPHLHTHKLSGELFELYACICGYDCRILFSIEYIKPNNEKVLSLVDIGTHDDVY